MPCQSRALSSASSQSSSCQLSPPLIETVDKPVDNFVMKLLSKLVLVGGGRGLHFHFIKSGSSGLEG